MRILLTGSTGFLGSALAHHWVALGHELCLLVRPSSQTDRIASLLGRVTIKPIAIAEDCLDIVRDFVPDAVVHTACSYGRRGESPLAVLDANMRLGVALLNATVLREDGRTIFINTGTVLAPEVSLYALSKTQFSQWGMALAREQHQRLQFIEVRLQQMFGPGDDRSKFVSHVIETCRLNEARLALTAGEQLRDFIHINDVVSAYDSILHRSHTLATGDIIDVGSGFTVTMRQFVELVHGLAGSTTQLDFGAVPYRENEAMLCVADTSRLRALGWAPAFDLASGLRNTLTAGPPLTP